MGIANTFCPKSIDQPQIFALLSIISSLRILFTSYRDEPFTTFPIQKRSSLQTISWIRAFSSHTVSDPSNRSARMSPLYSRREMRESFHPLFTVGIFSAIVRIGRDSLLLFEPRAAERTPSSVRLCVGMIFGRPDKRLFTGWRSLHSGRGSEAAFSPLTLLWLRLAALALFACSRQSRLGRRCAPYPVSVRTPARDSPRDDALLLLWLEGDFGPHAIYLSLISSPLRIVVFDLICMFEAHRVRRGPASSSSSSSFPCRLGGAKADQCAEDVCVCVFHSLSACFNIFFSVPPSPRRARPRRRQRHREKSFIHRLIMLWWFSCTREATGRERQPQLCEAERFSLPIEGDRHLH